MAKSSWRKFLVGVKVRLKKPISWQELRIPKGAKGTILSMSGDARSVVVQFGKGYGHFECWLDELRPA